MKKQKLLVRKFCFVNSSGRKASRQFTLQELLIQSDFTDNDVENICALPIGEVLDWPHDEYGVRRIK